MAYGVEELASSGFISVGSSGLKNIKLWFFKSLPSYSTLYFIYLESVSYSQMIAFLKVISIG